ncbi:PREDICTED: decapping and exoribonuclease protein-like [Priapulus caudatus]|uniref:Decapping nuclease n=1 Tax=Priapulus caudatus TaxID=37621 RepID=A0ABM1E6D7_PRICU|nr:PREDICTED: decapping and exoribonuclease protein-like [Priapulus caudatus]XP_014667759.1 PREDICTED: decapping and exoribonuclease protein-like [Priapulus caudatus]
MCTPYENREGWIVCVTKFKNTYYMCEFETDKRVKDRERETERQKEMSFWGFKFEQYLTAGDRHMKPDTSKPVNNNEAYCTVVRTSLASHSLLFAGEVDCLDAKSSAPKPGCYVELKTSRMIEHQGHDRSFKKFKLIKWWLQSFLVGIPRIICGFRTDEGVVTSLQEYGVADIPKIIRSLGYLAWHPTACVNFCDHFLTFVKTVVVEDDSSVIYKFEWSAQQFALRWEKLHQPSSFGFLPDWYIGLQH